MPQKPAMKHVAKAARVSLMTVSLALRDHPSISETTRRHVRVWAEKLGYRPNPLVSALMADVRSRRAGRTSPVVAFVNAFPAETHWKNLSSIKRLREGLRRRGEQLGYSIEEFKLGAGELTEARLTGILRARGIRGVVFAPFPQPATRLEGDWRGFACAALGCSLAYPHFHTAVNHQTHSLRLAFSELRKLGYRRIGLALSTYEDDRVEHNWMSSFLYERRLASAEKVELPLLLAKTWDDETVVKWTRRVKPDAIVTTGLQVGEMLVSAGMGVPQDIGVAYLHLMREMAGCSGIHQNDELIAGSALDLVVEQLHVNSFGPPVAPKFVHVEGAWVAGGTTRRTAAFRVG